MQKKNTKVDKAIVVFCRERQRWEISAGKRRLIRGNRILTKRHFDAYEDAVTFLTNRKLGFVDEADKISWDVDNPNLWTPVSLTRIVHTPGQGTVVTKYPLEESDGKTKEA